LTLLIWVDTFCINQEDFNERSEQVKLMRDIYNKATRTLVWLGAAGAESDLAMEVLEKLETEPSPRDYFLSMLQLHRADALFEPLEGLLKRPYWRRLWIIQEVICSADVILYCGEHSVTYPTLKNLIETFTDEFQKLTEYSIMERYAKLLDQTLGKGPAHISRKLHAERKRSPTLFELFNLPRVSHWSDP
jgi:Heterokaryon incompatibility protein (HET)